MKKKIITYSIILVLLLTCLGLGAMALLANDTYKNNKVTFEVDNNKAYCEISGKYYYNGDEVTEKAYSPVSYTSSSDLNEEPFEGFSTWNIGESKFDVEYAGADPESFTYLIVIKNYNTEKALSITLSDIAVGEKIKTNKTVMCFYTTVSYQINLGNSIVEYSNVKGSEVNAGYYASGQMSVDINNPMMVPVGSTINIKITLQRNTQTEQFDLANNIKLNIGLDE